MQRSLFFVSQEGIMTRFEFLAVLRSIDKVADLGTKEDVQKLIKEMISDAEGKSSDKNTTKE
jgi:hypothetical protein